MPIKRFLPYVLVLSCGVIWGLTFSLARIATQDNAHPIGLSFWQAIGGCIILLCFCLVRGRRLVINRQVLGQCCVIAILGTAIPGTLYFYAASRVPAGVLAITVSLVPMLTYGLAWLARVERFNRIRVTGVACGFVGILLLILPETSLPDVRMVPWLLLALSSTIFYTFENLYIDMYIPLATDLVFLLAGGLLIAGIVLIPFVYFQDAFVPIDWPLTKIEWAIVGMALVSSVAYLMFLYIVKMAGSVFASMTGYLITLMGVVWGIIFFEENHSIWVWTSLVLMLLGMGLVTPRRTVQAGPLPERMPDPGQ